MLAGFKEFVRLVELQKATRMEYKPDMDTCLSPVFALFMFLGLHVKNVLTIRTYLPPLFFTPSQWKQFWRHTHSLSVSLALSLFSTFRCFCLYMMTLFSQRLAPYQTVSEWIFLLKG